ncbi:MAG: hypothetical protein ABI867_38555 [Kofleriaceae bacterium]
MRSFIVVSLVSGLSGLSACAAEVGSAAEPEPASVRERFERGETLAIEAPASAGAITAQRRANGGWEAGLVDLAIERGELIVSADGEGAISLDHLAIGVGPIAIPEDVLGYGVQLVDVEVSLVRPVRMVTEWDGDDESTAHADLELALTWSLENHGSTSPLGSPMLPPLPVELAITGSAEHVHAELRVRAPGELWSWADLIKLEDLTLIVVASTR